MQPIPEFNMALYLPDNRAYVRPINQALTSSSNHGGSVATGLIRMIERGTQAEAVDDQRMRVVNHLCQLAHQALSTFEMECFEENCARELEPEEKALVEIYQQGIREQLTGMIEFQKENALNERDIRQTNMDHQLAFHKNVMSHQFKIAMKHIEGVKAGVQLIYELQIKQVEHGALDHDLHLSIQKTSFDQWLLQEEQVSLENEQSAKHRLAQIKLEHQGIIAMKEFAGLENETDFISQEMELSQRLEEAKLELETVKIEAETRRRIAAAQRKSGGSGGICFI